MSTRRNSKYGGIGIDKPNTVVHSLLYFQIRTRKDNIAGVNLPVFETYQDGSDSYELAGLARGGQQMQT